MKLLEKFNGEHVKEFKTGITTRPKISTTVWKHKSTIVSAVITVKIGEQGSNLLFRSKNEYIDQPVPEHQDYDGYLDYEDSLIIELPKSNDVHYYIMQFTFAKNMKELVVETDVISSDEYKQIASYFKATPETVEYSYSKDLIHGRSMYAILEVTDCTITYLQSPEKKF